MNRYLQALIVHGFDASYISHQGNQYGRTHYRPKCSSCEALVINGVACHESGCPQQPRYSEDDEEVIR